MKKISSVFCIALSGILLCGLLLSGCVRPTPDPGRVLVIPPLTKGSYSPPGLLVGRTVTIQVTSATPSMQSLVGKKYQFFFFLNEYYTMNTFTWGPILLNHGTYTYAIDYHHLHQAMLTLMARRGVNMIFTYDAPTSGTFYAIPSNAQDKGHIEGRFTIKLTHEKGAPPQ